MRVGESSSAGLFFEAFGVRGWIGSKAGGGYSYSSSPHTHDPFSLLSIPASTTPLSGSGSLVWGSGRAEVRMDG